MSIIALVALAIWALVLAFAPRWRARYRWGRGPGRFQATRAGCLVLAVALAAMAGGLTAQTLKLVREPFGYLAVVAGFLGVMAAGLLDRLRR